MLLATDLDRTLLPNGQDPYEEGSIEDLFKYLEYKDHILTYVTGRNLRLVKEAIEEYQIPVPDYLIGEVGTMVYKKNGNELEVHSDWFPYLKDKAPLWQRDELIKVINEIIPTDLELQEEEFQNEYKISFYVKGDLNEEIAKLREANEIKKAEAEIVYSFDPIKKTGLLDILPKVATKVTALEFLRKKLKIEKDDVIYAGDSGNDILPLSFGYKAIVVKNAHADTKDQVKENIKRNNLVESVYFATGEEEDGNGNYASGVLEGLRYYLE